MVVTERNYESPLPEIIIEEGNGVGNVKKHGDFALGKKEEGDSGKQFLEVHQWEAQVVKFAHLRIKNSKRHWIFGYRPFSDGKPTRQYF